MQWISVEALNLHFTPESIFRGEIYEIILII